MRFVERLCVGVAVAVLASNVGGDPGDQLHKLLPDDGAERDYFAFPVSISGPTVVVGSNGDDIYGDDSGSAYVFDASTGEQQLKLIPSDGTEYAGFGYSVAVNGTTAIIGATVGEGAVGYSGVAYLFDTTTGAQLGKIYPEDGAQSDMFGCSVDLDGGVAIVGAYKDDDNGDDSGSAYLFDVSSGAQIAKLTPSDGESMDWFGNSVAIRGGIAIVGAMWDDDNGVNAGAAYLFDANTGAELMKIYAVDGAANDYFGWTVDISGRMAIVGAYLDDDNGGASGSAYLFRASTGEQIAKLLADDGLPNDQFGYSVAIGETTAIVGAHYDGDLGSGSGSAYLFDTSTGAQLAKLLAEDGASQDEFGVSVSVSGMTAVVGAYRDDDLGTDSGSAYVFDATNTIPCLQLDVDHLVAGEEALFTVTGGMPGVRGVTVWGTQGGQTTVNDVAGYCATFAISGVKQNRVLGGLNQTFDESGEISFALGIPGKASGVNVLFQSAERATCPDECVSNLVEQIVQ